MVAHKPTHTILLNIPVWHVENTGQKQKKSVQWSSMFPCLGATCAPAGRQGSLNLMTFNCFGFTVHRDFFNATCKLCATYWIVPGIPFPAGESQKSSFLALAEDAGDGASPPSASKACAPPPIYRPFPSGASGWVSSSQCLCAGAQCSRSSGVMQ